MKNQFKITKPIRLIELFAGIGSQAMALRDLGANFETYKVIEFDKFAIKSYNAIHGTNFPTIDILDTKGEDLEIVNSDKFEYIMTYSFPCQDLSIAGKQQGMKKGSGTRSGLLWEVERLLNECEELPQVLVMENVPQVHNKKNVEDFKLWLKFLESKGYKNYYKDLNAKNYGVAQYRNRCFCISLLSEDPYIFPEEVELKKTINDYLEPIVDDKYYLSDEKAQVLLKQISACNYKENIFLGRCRSEYGKQVRKEYEKHNIKVKRKDYTTLKPTKENISTTIQTGNTDKLVLCYLNYYKVSKENAEISKTLCARDYKGFGTGFHTMNGVYSNYRIRRLTPLEYWRLMSFSDEDFYKAEAVNSNTQLYKQAGNSIVEEVLKAIFKQML